jgi:hypothetical protein
MLVIMQFIYNWHDVRPCAGGQHNIIDQHVETSIYMQEIWSLHDINNIICEDVLFL